MLTQGGLKSRVALMPKGQDPDTLLREHGPEAVRAAVTKGVEPIEYLLQQIGLRHSPEKEEYWQEATAALARLKSQLEVERYLMPLATRYPFMRDPERAITTLRGMVRNARRKASAPTSEDAMPTAPAKGLPMALPSPLEAAPFRALADTETREAAWQICRSEDLFVTETARRLSRALVSAWLDLPAETDVADLIRGLPDEKDRDLFAAVLMLDGPPMDESAVADVLERLERRRDEIALKSSVPDGEKSDEDLICIDARLKELKGAKPLEKSPENRLDSQPDRFV
jgi:DNA primase